MDIKTITTWQTHLVSWKTRIAALSTVALVAMMGFAGPAYAGTVDSGHTCGKTAFITYSWGIPTRWTYQGTTARYGAHKHIWDGDRYMNGTVDYNNYQSVGWCADAH